MVAGGGAAKQLKVRIANGRADTARREKHANLERRRDGLETGVKVHPGVHKGREGVAGDGVERGAGIRADGHFDALLGLPVLRRHIDGAHAELNVGALGVEVNLDGLGGRLGELDGKGHFRRRLLQVNLHFGGRVQDNLHIGDAGRHAEGSRRE